METAKQKERHLQFIILKTASDCFVSQRLLGWLELLVVRLKEMNYFSQIVVDNGYIVIIIPKKEKNVVNVFKASICL